MKRLCLGSAALILCLASSVKADQQAYIWDGNTMQPVRDTRDLACRKWSIWLFTSDDRTRVPGQQWGNIIGESESDVTDQLRNDQAIEDVVTAGAGPGTVNWLTYHNYTGPICNVKPPAPDINDDLDQLETLGGRLEDAYSLIRKLWPANKSALTEQMSQIIETIQRVNKLRNDLMQRNGAAMMSISTTMEEITVKTAIVQGQSQQLARRLSPAPSVNANPPAGNGWTQQQVNVMGANIAQSVQVNGSQIQVRQMVVNDPNGQGQAYSFPAQSIDPAAINVKPQGALWVVSVRSTSRNIGLQVTNGGGGVANEVVSSVDLYFSTQAQAQAAAQGLSQLAGH